MLGEVGPLAVGAWGDAVVFELREGAFELMDARGETRVSKQKLEPVVVVKGGSVYSAAADRWLRRQPRGFTFAAARDVII